MPITKSAMLADVHYLRYLSGTAIFTWVTPHVCRLLMAHEQRAAVWCVRCCGVQGCAGVVCAVLWCAGVCGCGVQGCAAVWCVRCCGVSTDAGSGWQALIVIKCLDFTPEDPNPEYLKLISPIGLSIKFQSFLLSSLWHWLRMLYFLIEHTRN